MPKLISKPKNQPGSKRIDDRERPDYAFGFGHRLYTADSNVETFDLIFKWHADATYKGITFVECDLTQYDPIMQRYYGYEAARGIIRNVKFVDCRFVNCNVDIPDAKFINCEHEGQASDDLADLPS